MDPLRGEIVQNLIQNFTEFLFRFISERNYHNYHNYPRNNILPFNFRFFSGSSVIKNILAPITMRIIFISHWTDYYFISRRTNGRRFRGSQMAEIAERPCGMFSLRQSLWELSLSITELTIFFYFPQKSQKSQKGLRPPCGMIINRH